MTNEDLRAWRLQMEMTRKQLAEFLGVSPRTVQLWEKGDVRIPASVSLLIFSINELEKLASRVEESLISIFTKEEADEASEKEVAGEDDRCNLQGDAEAHT